MFLRRLFVLLSGLSVTAVISRASPVRNANLVTALKTFMPVPGTVDIAISHRFRDVPPFGPLVNGNWTCFSSSSTPMPRTAPRPQRCLPPGQSYRMDRLHGYDFDWSAVDTMIIAAGSYVLDLAYQWDQGQFTWVESIVANYSTSQTASDHFGNVMQKFARERTVTLQTGLGISQTLQGIQPPSVCIYSEPKFEGNFTCFGPGAGNLSPEAIRTMRSVKVTEGTMEGWFQGIGASHSRNGLQQQFVTGDYSSLSPQLDRALVELKLTPNETAHRKWDWIDQYWYDI
ncbi:MAG: hypothetical protein M1838_005508 [Thelocarpon superellum]|nr:MAG: hypothetical protein M1838_005508 [Thelocarpon superellum]